MPRDFPWLLLLLLLHARCSSCALPASGMAVNLVILETAEPFRLRWASPQLADWGQTDSNYDGSMIQQFSGTRMELQTGLS